MTYAKQLKMNSNSNIHFNPSFNNLVIFSRFSINYNKPHVQLAENYTRRVQSLPVDSQSLLDSLPPANILHVHHSLDYVTEVVDLRLAMLLKQSKRIMKFFC